MASPIELSTGFFPEIQHVRSGERLVLKVSGNVMMNENGKFMFDVRTVDVSERTPVGVFDELLAISRKNLSEIQQVPKVSPLGNT